MTWTKHPPYTGEKHIGCLTCTDGTPDTAPMDMVLAVGFGVATVTKGQLTIYDETWLTDDDEFWTVADAECDAAADPDHDWQITLDAPLRSMTYQRQGPEAWILIDSTQGFA